MELKQLSLTGLPDFHETYEIITERGVHIEITVLNGRITSADLPARWTIGKDIRTIRAYYLRQGATVQRLPPPC